MVRSQAAICNRKKYQREYRQRLRVEDREGVNKQMRDYKKASARHFFWRFGLTPEDFNLRISHQKGLCLACNEPLDLTVEKTHSLAPVVDHDHACCSSVRSCGKCIRGILHRQCNMGLGQFKDNPVRLRLAAEYLERYSRCL